MTAALSDSLGRPLHDLRISVTDRCNLRCRYCMPEEGLAWLPREELLTFEEIERVARLCIERFGVESIRLTGGEPTLRAHLPTLVGMLSPLVADLSLTTNGAGFALLAADLRAAGLDRVNISCDSLRRDRFESLTRRDRLTQVLAGIDAAVAAGFDPVKVNCVLVRGVNDDEIVDFARFGRERGVVVRFIEVMPLDADGAWTPESVVPGDEVVARVAEAYPLEPVESPGPDPASRYRYLDGNGEIGVVASVTRSFCGSCDRVRLTAEGMLRNCLFALEETDLRAVVRGGGSDDDLADAVVRCVGAKWAGHSVGRVNFVPPGRTMSRIGG